MQDEEDIPSDSEFQKLAETKKENLRMQNLWGAPPTSQQQPCEISDKHSEDDQESEDEQNQQIVSNIQNQGSNSHNNAYLMDTDNQNKNMINENQDYMNNQANLQSVESLKQTEIIQAQ